MVTYLDNDRYRELPTMIDYEKTFREAFDEETEKIGKQRAYQLLHFGTAGLPDNYWVYHTVEEMALLPRHPPKYDLLGQ